MNETDCSGLLTGINWSFIGKGILARAFNFLLEGRKNLPLSRLNFGGISPGLMTGLMKKRNVATLEELFKLQ